jgi:hypothetical protein
MSSNKGKDGEMDALIAFATVAKNEENFDLTRPTTTNTPDMGADIILEHKENFIENTMLPLSTGKTPNTTPNTKVKQKTEKTRIDIKATEKKLLKDTVEKFISDTRKHPDCTNHMLIGGQNLTSPAKKRLDKANEDLKEDKKKLYYLNNDEMKNISDYYKKLETQNKNSNKSLDKNI